MEIKVLRVKEVLVKMGISNSSFYERIGDGLMPATFEVGPNATGLFEHEVNALVMARVAKKSDAEISKLVRELEGQRELMADYYLSILNEWSKK